MTTRPWSCDTFAVAGAHTHDGATLVGKNSDRPARESQPLRRFHQRKRGSRLRLAYVEIDDVAETLPHLGSSPYWCWGHEMGVNSSGVTIGNEALFTRDWAGACASHRAGQTIEPGILGMELLRLALERCDSAQSAVETMTDLVERYGQWGAGVAGTDRAEAAYDNSYLVADASQIWVVETSGRRWATRRVDSPTCAISNEPTIRDDWTATSADLAYYAHDRGWWRPNGRIDFAEVFADPGTPLQVSHLRLQRSRQLLERAVKAGGVGFGEARDVLSDHYEDTFLAGPSLNAARPDFHTLCMHDHPAGFTWGNTAASMVASIPKHGRTFMWWAAATPCTSLYVPVAVTGAELPAAMSTAGTQHGQGPHPEKVQADTYQQGSYWWTLQALLEEVAFDNLGAGYRERQPVVRSRFDQLQTEWLQEVDAMTATATDTEWDALTQHCVEQASEAARELLADFQAT